MISAAATLRRDAEGAVATLPPLLARALRLAASVSPGVHGRRRAGPGETFWQFRQAVSGDPVSAIDWRRSARQRVPMVRETEWESAQSVWFWLDGSLAMSFRSRRAAESKHRRGALLVLALSVLLVRAGERVGLLGEGGLPAASSERQLERMAAALVEGAGGGGDYGALPELPENCRGAVVAMSDFLGDSVPVQAGLRAAAGRGLPLRLLQLVDPDEETFPYAGRIRFESPGGGVRFQAEAADELAASYADRLAQLRAGLAALMRRTEGRFSIHRTDQSPASALIWLAGAIDGTF